MGVIGHVAGTPDRTDTLSMGGQQHAMRGTAGCYHLLGSGYLGVSLNPGDHHHQQWRAQRHATRLVQRFRRSMRIGDQQGLGEQLAHALTRLPLDRQKTPRT